MRTSKNVDNLHLTESCKLFRTAIRSAAFHDPYDD
jgi:hypothetical protein